MHPCFKHFVCHPTEVTPAAFDGRAGLLPSPSGDMFSSPSVHELKHDGRVVAMGIVDAECSLIPDACLPSRFSAVSLRSLVETTSDVPCWAWGNGALVEAVLRAVKVHTNRCWMGPGHLGHVAKCQPCLR